VERSTLKLAEPRKAVERPTTVQAWKRTGGALKRRRLVPMDNRKGASTAPFQSVSAADETHDASMDTTDRISTPEAAPEARPREAGRPLIALMIAVAGLTTAAWAFALVVLAGWLIAGVV